jgi:hypothetical protein
MRCVQRNPPVSAWADIVGHPDPEQRRRHLLAGTRASRSETATARAWRGTDSSTYDLYQQQRCPDRCRPPRHARFVDRGFAALDGSRAPGQTAGRPSPLPSRAGLSWSGGPPCSPETHVGPCRGRAIGQGQLLRVHDYLAVGIRAASPVAAP